MRYLLQPLYREAEKSLHSFIPPTPPVYLPTSTYRCGVIATKRGMTALWDHGKLVGATLLELNKVHVLESEEPKNKKHKNVLVGASPTKFKRIKDCYKSIFQTLSIPPLRCMFRFHVTSDSLLEPGTQIKTNHYELGSYVDVIGRTKGKGFQGVMKRWGFKGLPATHGVTKKHRSPGSLGACQDPGRVLKGKKMPGRMGNKIRMVRHVKIIKIEHDHDLLYVLGQVPGPIGSFLRLHDSKKK